MTNTELEYISETELGKRIKAIQDKIAEVRREAGELRVEVDERRERYRVLMNDECDLRRAMQNLIAIPDEHLPLGLSPIFMPS